MKGRIPYSRPVWNEHLVERVRWLVLSGLTNDEVAARIGFPVQRTKIGIWKYLPGIRSQLIRPEGAAAVLGIPRPAFRRMVAEKRARARMTRPDLITFLRDPENSHLWNPDRVADKSLLAEAGVTEKTWLTVKEFARAAGISAAYVYKLLYAGKLPSRRDGQLHLIHVSYVRRFDTRNGQNFGGRDDETHSDAHRRAGSAS